MSMLGFAQELCRGLTGSRCSAPRLSSWQLVNPGQLNIGADVADLGSAGVGALFPINAKVYGSYFSTGLVCDAPIGGMSAMLTCWGGGAGIGAGWSLPFVAAGATGKLPAAGKKIAESLGGAMQGTLIDVVKGGWSAGTRLVAGPDTNGDLTLSDFRDSIVTVYGLGANFVVNGVSGQLVILSKRKPIIEIEDMIYAKGIGLVAGVGFAVSLDLESNCLVYKAQITSG